MGDDGCVISGEAVLVPKNLEKLGGELMYEFDSLYASTEIVLSGRYRQPPLDGMLLEACLLHFRVIWGFFHGRRLKPTDVMADDFIPGWTLSEKPDDLLRLRERLNTMLAHLTELRVEPAYKQNPVTQEDIASVRAFARKAFEEFHQSLDPNLRGSLANPLAAKFRDFESIR